MDQAIGYFLYCRDNPVLRILVHPDCPAGHRDRRRNHPGWSHHSFRGTLFYFGLDPAVCSRYPQIGACGRDGTKSLDLQINEEAKCRAIAVFHKEPAIHAFDPFFHIVQAVAKTL